MREKEKKYAKIGDSMFGTAGFMCLCGKQDIKENQFRVWCDNCHSTLVNRIKEPSITDLEFRIKILEDKINNK